MSVRLQSLDHDREGDAMRDLEYLADLWQHGRGARLGVVVCSGRHGSILSHAS
jgi:hypothetical protein